MENDKFSLFLEELKAKNDIVSIVSRYVPLERKGRLVWGRCPFHNEKTPSFAVNEYDQFYHCFGCGVGGDVIKFVMEIESLDFMGAVHFLADLAHMEVPSFNSSSDEDNIKERKAEKDRLLALMKDTARHYVENLKSPHAKPGILYFEKRKISPEIARRFGLGYSIGFTEIIEYLTEKGYTLAEMEKAGVIKYKDDRPYDAIGGRIVFPILDAASNVIAFCGRTLDPNPEYAKYINTADTPLFSKSKNLYAINLVKKARMSGEKIDSMIIVEGQMDVVSLHKAGFNSAVASMGTALTTDQAKLIKRFVDKVYICYDGDTAGKKATLRGLDILKSNGLDVYVMSMPEGLDPDDVINRYGAEGYRKLMEKALPLVDFKIEFVRKLYDLNTSEGKTKFLNEAIEILRDLDEVEREVYIDKVSEMTSVLKDFIKRQVYKTDPIDNERENKEVVFSSSIENEKLREVITPDTKVVQAEKYILSAMLHRKPFAYFNTDISEYFTEKRPQYYKIIVDLVNNYPDKDLPNMFYERVSNLSHDTKDNEEASEIISYLLKNVDDEFEKNYFADCVEIVVKAHADREIEKLTKLLETASSKEQRADIMNKIKDLTIKSKLKKR